MREAKVLATPGMVAGIIFDNSGSVIYADGLAQILDDITGKYVLKTFMSSKSIRNVSILSKMVWNVILL